MKQLRHLSLSVALIVATSTQAQESDAYSALPPIESYTNAELLRGLDALAEIKQSNVDSPVQETVQKWGDASKADGFLQGAVSMANLLSPDCQGEFTTGQLASRLRATLRDVTSQQDSKWLELPAEHMILMLIMYLGPCKDQLEAKFKTP